jgi:Activator of Hsp90 ATPase homolog 1-like protein
VHPGASTVEVTLAPDGDGTRLRLVHRDLPESERAPHEGGWEELLRLLAIAATGGDPDA